MLIKSISTIKFCNDLKVYKFKSITSNSIFKSYYFVVNSLNKKVTKNKTLINP